MELVRQCSWISLCADASIMRQNETRVALCICTYRRPAGLRTVLSGIERLEFERIPTPALHIYVVENDERDGARSICAEYGRRLVWPVHYELESRPGLSHARNMCLELAAGHSDFIAFLDDDERPSPQWLEAMLLAQAAHKADVIAGPVIAVYDQPPPAWAANSPYHVRVTMQTGTRIETCGAGNVLFTTALVMRHMLRFDEAMGLCGGEDALFFSQARRAGAKLIWCDDAVIDEIVPVERTTLRWLIRRAFRIGIAKHRVTRQLVGTLPAIAQSVWFGSTRIGFGLLTLPWALARGQDRTVKALCRVAFGIGCLVGGGGGNINAYRPKA